MAYLRGNTVVDGNLFVEGSITYAGARPDMVDSTAVYKQSRNGLVAGRHLRCESNENGSLVDSSIRENIKDTGAVNDGHKLMASEFYFDLNNGSDAHINDPSDNSYTQDESILFKVTLKYPVNKIFIVDSQLYPSGGSIINADEIEEWTYIGSGS